MHVVDSCEKSKVAEWLIGREQPTSLASWAVLRTMIVEAPALMEKIGPYLWAIFVNVLWGFFSFSWRRFPITGKPGTTAQKYQNHFQSFIIKTIYLYKEMNMSE